MDTQVQDKPKEYIDIKDGEMPFYEKDDIPAADKTSDSSPIDIAKIPQGPGSTLDADTIAGTKVMSAAVGGPNVIVTTDNSGKLPTSVIPSITGKVVQIVVGSTGTNATKSGTIPDDNTIPQNTEGDSILTASITPTSATSKLYVVAVVQLDTTLRTLIGSLCWDQGANALAAFRYVPTTAGANAGGPFTLTTVQTAGVTTAITFSVRAGNDSASTYYVNADTAGNARFGGVMLSSITIMEITQ